MEVKVEFSVERCKEIVELTWPSCFSSHTRDNIINGFIIYINHFFFSEEELIEKFLALYKFIELTKAVFYSVHILHIHGVKTKKFKPNFIHLLFKEIYFSELTRGKDSVCVLEKFNDDLNEFIEQLDQEGEVLSEDGSCCVCEVINYLNSLRGISSVELDFELAKIRAEQIDIVYEENQRIIQAELKLEVPETPKTPKTPTIIVETLSSKSTELQTVADEMLPVNSNNVDIELIRSLVDNIIVLGSSAYPGNVERIVAGLIKTTVDELRKLEATKHDFMDGRRKKRKAVIEAVKLRLIDNIREVIGKIKEAQALAVTPTDLQDNPMDTLDEKIKRLESLLPATKPARTCVIS